MRYRGFKITACDDRGVERYNSAENLNEICDGYFCEVYPVDDYNYGYQLDTFCLAEGYEIPDTYDRSLNFGIRQYVDDNYYSLQEAKNVVKQKRSEELISKLVCWLSEIEIGAELYNTLSYHIGMTDEEILAIGFRSLAPFFDQWQYAQTIADWLIENGTQSTLSGSWSVQYGNIENQFGVNLQTDEKLRNMVSHYLYDSSDIVADFCMDTDKVDLVFFLAFCPYVNLDEAENEDIKQDMR